MGKSILFTGQPIFSQLLKLIPDSLFVELSRKHNSDRYCKKFDSKHHLVTMLFAVFNQCTSIREVITGLEVATPKLGHIKLGHNIRRSTFADANARRPEAFFRDLYHRLYSIYYGLPDSRQRFNRKSYGDRLFIMDATTITLFQDVLKGAVITPANGKRKGGLKAHMLVKADEDVPCLVNLTASAVNDKKFFAHVSLPTGSIIVFDKGYAHFGQFEKWTKAGISWVTRSIDKWHIHKLQARQVSQEQADAGIRSDELVVLGSLKQRITPKINARIIKYTDPQTKKHLSFVTNNTELPATTIADIYKCRWQIEILFKRIKQGYPLRYFLGDSANAIKIQVWCALVADLLVKIVKDKLTRKWAYANLCGMIRLHLMTYVHLKGFLENPDKALRNYHPNSPDSQLKLFSSA